MDFKNVLKNRRSELGLTLLEIAKAVGVTEATVQRWESGNIKSLRHERIVKLAEVLKITPAELMGWEKEKPPAEASDPQTEIFIKLLRKMTPEQKQKLADYMINLIAADNQ